MEIMVDDYLYFKCLYGVLGKSVVYQMVIYLLLGVRRLHDQGRFGNECSGVLQLLLAAIEFGLQGSAIRPHFLSCR